MFILASCDDYFSNNLFQKLKSVYNDFVFIKDKNNLKNRILEINPEKVFFFHWSYIVPKVIYNNYECINLHTSNLPYGKGGSPLQNQILDNITLSKVNALRMSDDGLDSGPIYCSQDVTLQGSLFDIFNMLEHVSYKLIIKIIEKKLVPVPQIKIDAPVYKRRRDNRIPFNTENNIDKIYDFIRMLDSSYYPNPFFRIGKYQLEFKRASFDGEEIIADVKITKINEIT